MVSSSSIGDTARWCLCGFLLFTLVLQQARNVMMSLRTNVAYPIASSWTNDLQQQNRNLPLESSPSSSSSWMGNYWIPPPDQPLYSGLDFQLSFPPHQPVLMIGDIWLRHSYAMLFAILNNTENPANVRVITLQETVDYALKDPAAQCSRYPNRTHCWGLPSLTPRVADNEVYSYDFVQADCLSHAVRVLESALELDKCKWIILGVGNGCTETTEGVSFEALREQLSHLLSRNKDVAVVWRTTPNLVEARQGASGLEAVLTEDHIAFNDEIRKAIRGLPLTILDWAATLEPKARIRPLPVKQNLVPPTSQAAQLALLQQLLHTLVTSKNSDGSTARQIEIR